MGHCFMGLCYEALRTKAPDTYRWQDTALIHTKPCPFMGAQAMKACEHLKQWLGMPSYVLIDMMAVNDRADDDLSWRELWEVFENLLKDAENWHIGDLNLKEEQNATDTTTA